MKKNKKKIIAVCLAGAILSSTMIVNAATETGKIMYGDVDQNGRVDLSDLITMCRYAIKDIEFDEETLQVADVTKDGEVNVGDIALLKQYLMGDSIPIIGSLLESEETTQEVSKVSETTIEETSISEVSETSVETTVTTPVTTTTPITTKITTTTPVTTTTIDTSSWGLTSQQIDDSAKLINSIRTNNAMGELKIDYALCAAANQRAKELTVKFSETRLDGSSYRTLYEEFGANYNRRGEVYAKGYSSYSVVINKFASSDVMLNQRYIAFGIGYDPNGKTWSILFGV